jgi:hypothetical protein
MRASVATQEFNCPDCGALLNYPVTGATMCYLICGTSVEMPTKPRAIDAANAPAIHGRAARPGVPDGDLPGITGGCKATLSPIGQPVDLTNQIFRRGF